MNCREAEPLLGAYLDGELDAAHNLEMEAHLERCEPCSRALRIQEDLSALVSGAARYRARAELRRRLEHRAGRRLGRMASWLAVAATLVIGLITWRLIPRDRFVNEVAQSHLRSLEADHLLDVPSDRDIRPWFAAKLDYMPDVEDLSWRGFSLAGARLDSVDGRPVAALVYRHAQHVVSVFVWPVPGEPDRPPAVRKERGFQVVGWRANGLAWWAVSDLDQAELEQLPLCPCFLPVNRPLG